MHHAGRHRVMTINSILPSIVPKMKSFSNLGLVDIIPIEVMQTKLD